MKKILFLLFLIPIAGFSQNKKALIATVNRLKSDSVNLQSKIKNKVEEIKINENNIKLLKQKNEKLISDLNIANTLLNDTISHFYRQGGLNIVYNSLDYVALFGSIHWDSIVRKGGDNQELLITLKEEPFSGYLLKNYENGQLQGKLSYVDGKKDGISLTYYEDGQLQVKMSYVDGKQDGIALVYYENGQLQLKASSVDGKQDGIMLVYYEDGQLQVKMSYVDGKQDGINLTYYEDGQLQGKVSYVDGKLDGIALVYYEDGQLKGKISYLDGKLDGISFSYYENGQLKEEGSYVDGKKDGEFIFYGLNGEKKIKNYKNGKRV